MLGGLGNLSSLMKQASEIKDRMERMRAELERQRYTAQVGGGAVTAVVDGSCNLVDISIKPDAVGDVEFLEDLIKSAIGAAMTKARDGMAREMSKLTGGVNIPGLTDMLGAAGTS